jgi:hypothetical protein
MQNGGAHTAMFIEIGSFEAPKCVLCLGMRPHPDGVLVDFLHSNQSRLELASEQIVGLQHYQLHLVLREPPYNPVSPFLNLKRENIPAIAAWCEKLENGKINPNERPPRSSAKPTNIHVDIGTYSSPRTVSPIVIQPEGDDVSISYLDDSPEESRRNSSRVRHNRIVGLTYEQLLMAFKTPPPDRNSPFLNLKVENIPGVVEYLRRLAPEHAAILEPAPRRTVGFPEARRPITTARPVMVSDRERQEHLLRSTS